MLYRLFKFGIFINCNGKLYKILSFFRGNLTKKRMRFIFMFTLLRKSDKMLKYLVSC